MILKAVRQPPDLFHPLISPPDPFLLRQTDIEFYYYRFPEVFEEYETNFDAVCLLCKVGKVLKCSVSSASNVKK